MNKCAKCGKRLTLLDLLLGIRINVTGMSQTIYICWDCKRKNFNNLFN